MSRLLDDDEDDVPQRERELTLSIGAILAIFLGLVLLCGVFFGFGYNLGRKSATASNAAVPAVSNETEPVGTSGPTFNSLKPSPSSPSGPAATSTSTSPSSSPQVVTKSSPETASDAQPATAPAHAVPVPSPSSTALRPAPASATNSPAPIRPAAPAITPGGAFVVQIAAISPAHKDDADLLANALHSKGYAVAERTETQDKLIHIQVGPFATKADAEAMRERLIVDGYNAIVK